MNEDEEKRNAEEVARKTWDNWVNDLEGKEQPKACDIDADDCENCGS